MIRDPKGALVFRLLWSVVVLVAGTPIATAAAAEVEPLHQLTRSAELIFRGTVHEVGVANLAIVEPNERTAIVRVEEVLKITGSLDDFTGREITVFAIEALKPGEQHVFFTRVCLIGESLGVQEVGRAEGSIPKLAAKVREAQRQAVRTDLTARLNGADLVVSGKIVETRHVAPPSGRPITEHDPEWREAVLEVSSVAKGEAPKGTLSFLYPGSLDVLWMKAPKPTVGLIGTWLLHRQEQANTGAVFAAFDPQDLLSDEEAKVALTWVKP